jgi:hypothetical protein
MIEVSQEEVDAYEKKHKQQVDVLLVAFNLLNALRNLSDVGNYKWDLKDIDTQIDATWEEVMKFATSKVYPYDWLNKKYYRRNPL